jgi:hypothetical protein
MAFEKGVCLAPAFGGVVERDPERDHLSGALSQRVAQERDAVLADRAPGRKEHHHEGLLADEVVRVEDPTTASREQEIRHALVWRDRGRGLAELTLPRHGANGAERGEHVAHPGHGSNGGRRRRCRGRASRQRRQGEHAQAKQAEGSLGVRHRSTNGARDRRASKYGHGGSRVYTTARTPQPRPSARLAGVSGG